MSDAGSNVVPIFKTFDELQQEQYEIELEHANGWNQACRKYRISMAAITDNDVELTKIATSDAEIRLAKSDATRMKATRNGDVFFAKLDAMVEFTTTLKSLNDKRDARAFGFTALARRS